MKSKFPKEFYKDLIIGTAFMCIALILTVIVWVTDSGLDTILGGVVLVASFMGYIKLAPVIIAYPRFRSDNCNVELDVDGNAADAKSDDVNNLNE